MIVNPIFTLLLACGLVSTSSWGKMSGCTFFFSPAKIPTSYVHFGNKRSTLLQQNGWNWPSWSVSSLTRLYSHISVWDNKIFCTHSLFHLLVFFFNHEELPVPSFVINRTTLSSKELAVSGFFFIYIFSWCFPSLWLHVGHVNLICLCTVPVMSLTLSGCCLVLGMAAYSGFITACIKRLPAAAGKEVD